MNPPGSKRLPASPDEWLTHALSDLKLGKLGQKNKGIRLRISHSEFNDSS